MVQLLVALLLLALQNVKTNTYNFVTTAPTKDNNGRAGGADTSGKNNSTNAVLLEDRVIIALIAIIANI